MKPYIKKIRTASGVKIWQVDGNYVRNKMDTNFNNSGHHFSFDIIPKGELWIDKDFSQRGDEELLISQGLKELELIKKKKYDTYKAMVEASRHAEKERKLLNEIPKKDVYDHVYVKKFPEYSINGIKVWLINGKLVRDTFYIFFTEGGHHYVYKFVPKDEIWIDDSLNPKEYDYVLFHEAIERNLMKYNKMIYDNAHDVAIKYEAILRRTKTDPVPLIMNELRRKK